jgi:phosphoserine phosphatase RsbU/P
MASLIFTSGPNAGRRYPLDGRDLLLGRRSDCHIHIPELHVSRLHARIWQEGARWMIEDLRSRCGTFLNGERLRRPAILEDRDELSFAQSSIRVELTRGAGHAVPDPELALIDLDHPRVYVSAGAEAELAATDDPKRALRLLERQLAALRAILELTATGPELGQLFDALARELLEVFPRTDVACVLAHDPPGGRLGVRALCRRDAGDGVEIPRVLLESLAVRAGGVLLDDERRPQLTTSRRSGEAEPRGARMGAPIRVGGQAFGVLYVEGRGRELRRDDLDLLVSIALHVGLVVEAARMHEELLRRERLDLDLRVARQIQRSLLPSQSGPEIPGLEVAIHYAPAYEIGGDFYDFIWHDTRRIALVVGDVAGKAVSAALYMARLTSELRSRAGSCHGPSELLARVNEEMCALGDEGMFATLVYAIYDCETRELVFTNAGHVTPLLRREGKVITLHAERAHVPPLGFEGSLPRGEGRVELRRGDLLILATDGIPEARDASGREYGIDRLSREVAAAGRSPALVLRKVLRDVERHVGKAAQSDDVTLLAVSVV